MNKTRENEKNRNKSPKEERLTQEKVIGQTAFPNNASSVSCSAFEDWPGGEFQRGFFHFYFRFFFFFNEF